MKRIAFLLPILLLFIACSTNTKQNPKNSNYDDLATLFLEWREFESPEFLNGAPDYTEEGFKNRESDFKALRKKLNAFDTTGWSIPQKADWYIIWAEMNGYEFNTQILKPWDRDPSFYKSVWTYRSDVPAHEGPTHHATTELWTYDFPLSSEEKKRLIKDLNVIPALHNQAKINLKKGNAKELFITGIRDIEFQIEDLKYIYTLPKVKDDKALCSALDNALLSTEDFVKWMKEEAKHKTGPSGLGKENYSWYLQKVHLVPLSWEDEVMILKNELARAWSFLMLEEHRNRDLPEIVSAESPEEYQDLAVRSVKSMMKFLKEKDIITVQDYFEETFMAHLGEYSPKETRNFFWITAHHDPRPLYSHFYHWLELARMDITPHPNIIRREALLYNIFDSRNEGIATGVEELFMQAGFYDDAPRVREIVYILIAQRAARGLGSLYAHANEMTMEEAGDIHTEYTPRGWMKTVEDLKIFEQHLYMRQPGYGTSYITGKFLVEDAMKDYAKLLENKGEKFSIKDFLDRLNAMGCIPMSLCHWELTGNKDHMKIIHN